ncbi:MAG: alpha/beta fold hydrolase [Chloroflexota bacterium]
MQYAEIDGISLEYEMTGSPEPVIFIHGALIANSFRPLLADPRLTDRYQLVAYHRRGYEGSSPAADSTTIAGHAGDCRRLLRYLGIEKAHVVGHSYGGIVAIQFALDYPECVQSLSLLEAALLAGGSASMYKESIERDIAGIRESNPADIVDAFLEVRFGKGYLPGIERTVPGAFQQALDNAITTFESDLPALLEWHFDEAEAQRIHQPALIVLGEKSKALSPRFEETYDTLLRWLPDAEGFTLPDATHAMQMENPDAAAQGLVDFLARHPIRGSA